jgi:hypothetical protein
MPGYKKPMMYDKKPQFNAKLKEAAKEGKLDGSPKFKSAVEKSMMYKPMKHHGPYKLGSISKNNTEGIFRKEAPQMYHSKKPMMFKPSKNPMMAGETREQIKKRELRLQEESRERARKKRKDFMSGKKPNMYKTK